VNKVPQEEGPWNLVAVADGCKIQNFTMKMFVCVWRLNQMLNSLWSSPLESQGEDLEGEELAAGAWLSIC